MKFKPPLPLRIDTDGLSQKRAFYLADLLTPLFENVETWNDIIYCHNPLGSIPYDKAWRILDRFALKVT